MRSPILRLTRVAAWALVGVVALFCVLLLVVRFVAFPRLEAHRDDLALWLSRELEHPVEIDAIVTGWDGWNPEVSVRGLRVRDRAGAALQPLVELPEVTAALAWASLVVGELRLRELRIVKPRLSVRRDRDGRIHVAGFEFDPADHRPSDSRVTDWLLKQRLIVVRGALVTWNDDRRNAPQLLLDDVDFRLETRFGQHRFGLTGTPAPEIAAPIDLRGEVTTVSLADWRRGSGRLYLRLDYADVAAWSEWIPLPVDVVRGKGAMRTWFEFAEGTAKHVVTDVELADVRARLGDDLRPLDVAHVAGRFTWQHDGPQRALVVPGLVYAMDDGTRIAPGALEIRYTMSPDGTTTGGRFAVERLDLGSLTTLAGSLPLPAALRDDLARSSPGGTITGVEYAWDGPLRAPERFRTRGKVADVRIHAHETMPGLANLSGTFEASEAGGALRLAGRGLVVTMPRVFAEPIVLDHAAARVAWDRKGDALSVRLEDVEFANGHAAGTVRGTWRPRHGGPGDIDLSAHVRRADARHLHRYLPLVVDETTRHWLRGALRAGRSDDARLTLKGDLSRFPFSDGRSGTFIVTVKATDATLDYAPGWPALTGVDADLRFEGHGLSILASRGEIAGTLISQARAAIDDMSVANPRLAVEGETRGPLDAFVRFAQTSEVAHWSGGHADGVQAVGEGRLALKLALLLGHPDHAPEVAGELEIVDSSVTLRGVPPLAHVGGHLAFTTNALTGRDLRFQTLGGAGRVDLSARDGTLRVSGEGAADVASLERHFATSLPGRFAGSTDWRVDLTTGKGVTSWTLGSTLRGVSVDLPVPLGKPASEARTLRVERRPGSADRTRDTTIVDYGDTMRIVAQHRGDAVERALVLLGKATANRTAEPERPGVVVRGDVRSVNVDEWMEWRRTPAVAAAGSGATAPELVALDLEAGELFAFARRFDDMRLSARQAKDAWNMRIASRQLEGTATWHPADARHANGRLNAQLARLELAKVDEVRAQPDPPKPRTAGSANPWPQIDVTAERFIARAGDLGRLEMTARPQGTDWHITRFALVNDAGRIDANGWSRLVGTRQQTKLEVAIDVRDSGRFLARMGLPSDVKAAPAKLDGQLEWPGAPTDFEYAALSGTFGVKVGAGQFTKLDPGMGKLLGVLSLQALPRRISLDFRDVFSEGFAFDTISGTVAIKSGIMRTDNLMLAGPSAKVHLSGEVDLERETQKLAVRVQPSLSTVVSTGAGAAAVALLAANPLVGAAVGAGTLIAQRIMQDPIEQIFSYEYAVRGSWSEPVVDRVARTPTQALGGAAASESTR